VETGSGSGGNFISVQQATSNINCPFPICCFSSPPQDVSLLFKEGAGQELPSDVPEKIQKALSMPFYQRGDAALAEAPDIMRVSLRMGDANGSINALQQGEEGFVQPESIIMVRVSSTKLLDFTLEGPQRDKYSSMTIGRWARGETDAGPWTLLGDSAVKATHK